MDYLNKMAELVFIMIFNTHTCRTTERQKFKKPKNFKQANETMCWKKLQLCSPDGAHTFLYAKLTFWS